MKKLFFLSTCLMLTLFATAQTSFSIADGEPALVYALPKTEFLIEVQTEKVTQKPGVFYRYSERYLATNKVVTEEKTMYKIKDIVVRTRPIADPNRTFAVKPAKNSALNNMTVSADGLLCGINVTPPSKPNKPQLSSIRNEDAPVQTLLPLGEEYMMAGSEAKLAEGAAKQIYRIRESRLGLLTADVEKLPADGASFKAMLEGLNKMEQNLTELFVGKVSSEVQTQTLSFIPDASVSKQVLFRLSALRGLVASDDLSGAPVFVSITPTNAAAASAGARDKGDKTGIYTVLPVSCQLLIEDGAKNIFSAEYAVPQFGHIIPFPEALLSQPKLKVHIDSQTGRLLGTEQ
ncbi:MAG: DUF4831 family protein [Paludibacter sp.]|nr:DUF4831 family protein [Paludibacter sp.]